MRRLLLAAVMVSLFAYGLLVLVPTEAPPPSALPRNSGHAKPVTSACATSSYHHPPLDLASTARPWAPSR